MKEAEFLAAIAKLCNTHGITWHHCADSKRCQGDTGLPDLVLVGSRHIAFAELKQHTMDTRTKQQTAWYYALKACGVRAFLWHPADLPDIELEIKRLNSD